LHRKRQKSFYCEIKRFKEDSQTCGLFQLHKKKRTKNQKNCSVGK
jgi:hypothetical protein